MTYKLLALDVDGTLTNSQKAVTPTTLQALEKAEKAGLKVILATGRPTYGVAPIAEKLGMNEKEGYVLSFNGGKITEWHSRNVLYEQDLPQEMLPALYKKARENHVSIMTYHNEYVLSETTDDAYVQIEISLNHMCGMKVRNFLDSITFPVPKCIITGEPDIIERLDKELNGLWADRLAIYRSEPFFLEIMPKGIDKAHSLSVLIDKLGIQREEMIACGDGYNDIPMLQFAGTGVAMSNAQLPVLRIADYITASNDEEGITKVIEKFIHA